ncbi:hypothetical protein [Microcella sp.]|uniref:hypothetical protein n=1 Tax=Microcella sp. TaxID=1913979 RepID=UPI003918DAD6
MSEHVTSDATSDDIATQQSRALNAGSPLMPHRPRLRFVDGAGDGTAGNAPDADASEDDASDEQSADGADSTDKAENTLGDAGKKAIDAMKAERNAAKAAAREAAAALKKLQDELALKDKPAEEQALEQARAEARAEATKAANERILRSELRAVATGKLADPADAALFIDLTQFEVSDNGDVDTDALSDAIDELLTRKPHLGAVQKQRFDGDADQGARKSEEKRQVTRAELESMKPEEINKARREGRLNKILGIN